MVISIRVSEEKEAQYKRFAAENGMTVSEFMRKCADDVIAQAQAVLDEAEERRRHEERVADFTRRFEEFRRECDAIPTKELTDDDLYRMRLERYGYV